MDVTSAPHSELAVLVPSPLTILSPVGADGAPDARQPM